MMVRMTAGDDVAADRQECEVHAGGQDLLVSWHPPDAAPAGTRHGAEGVCVSGGEVVLVSPDGRGWSFPAGRPEAEESWEEPLLREVREEACATVIQARLLGFSRGVCVVGQKWDWSSCARSGELMSNSSSGTLTSRSDTVASLPERTLRPNSTW